jgi:glutamyl-tRNA reductase
VADLDGAFLYDIDDLQKVVQQNVESRRSEAHEAEKIIAEEVTRMMSRMEARRLAPTIVGLQQYLETIRTGEISRMRSRLGPMTPEQEEAIDALTRAMMNKVAHVPISELRRHAGTEHHHHFVDVIRRIFRVDPAR